MHPSFVVVAQKVKRAELIDDKNILRGMPFLLAAMMQRSVGFVAWTINGTFYAIMDKKGDVSVEGGGSSRNRCASSSAVRAGRRLCGESA
jgi:hypothetical protein